MKPSEILNEISKKNAEYNAQLSKIMGYPVKFVDTYDRQEGDIKGYVKPIG